jgi:hypothetical protein
MVIVLAACTGSTPAGAKLTIANGDANLASMPTSLEETMAGHIPSNYGLKVSQLLFDNSNASPPFVWFEIDLYEPVAKGDFGLVTKQVMQLAAGEAVISYQELGAEKGWASSGGMVTVTEASGGDVSVEFDGVPMMPFIDTGGTNNGSGSFTLSGTAVVHDFAAM